MRIAAEAGGRALGPREGDAMRAGHVARRIRTALLGTLGSAALLTVAGAAGALTMSPASLDFSGEGLDGTVELVEVTSGLPTGGTLLAGSADSVTLVFRATLAGGSASLDRVSVGVFDTSPFGGIPATGLGTFASDPGEDVASGSLASTGGTALFGFNTLDTGETTDRFFVFYGGGALEGDGSQSVSFGLRNDATQQSISPSPSATLIPEPGTLALLALGLGGLGAAARPSRS